MIRDKIQLIKSDFIRKVVEKNLNTIKQNLSPTGSFTDRNSKHRNNNSSGTLIKNNSMDTEKENPNNKNTKASNRKSCKTSYNLFKSDIENNVLDIANKNQINNKLNARNNFNFNNTNNKNQRNTNQQNNNFMNDLNFNTIQINSVHKKSALNKEEPSNSNSIHKNFIETNNKETFMYLNNNNLNNNQNKKIDLEAGIPNKNSKPLVSNRDKTSNDFFDKLLAIRDQAKNSTMNGKKVSNNNFIVSPSSSKEKFFSPNYNLKNTISNFKDIVNSDKIGSKTSNQNQKFIENKTNPSNLIASKHPNSQATRGNKIHYNPKTNEVESLNNLNNKKINLTLTTKENITSSKDKHNHRSQSEMIDGHHASNYPNLDTLHKKSTCHNKNSLSTFQIADSLKINHETKNNHNDQNNINVNEIQKLINFNKIKTNSKLNSKELLNNFNNLDFETKNFRSLNFNNIINENGATKHSNLSKKKGEDYSLNRNAENSNKENKHDSKKQNEINNMKILFKKFSVIKNSDSNGKGKIEKKNADHAINTKPNSHLVINNNNNNIINNNFFINSENMHVFADKNKIE